MVHRITIDKRAVGQKIGGRGHASREDTGGRFQRAKRKHQGVPMAVLKLPDLESSKSAVLNSLTSASSKPLGVRLGEIIGTTGFRISTDNALVVVDTRLPDCRPLECGPLPIVKWRE